MHRKASSPKFWFVVVVALFAVAVVTAVANRASADRTQVDMPTNTPPSSLLLVRNSGTQPSVLLRYTGMDISFNRDLHIPNWVAWELTRDETLGTEKRSNRFMTDPHVEGSASPEDYSYTPYDRGHMAPAGDMKWSADAMQQSFFMTNICPQAHSLNAGAWRKLEEKCRLWASIDSSLIIIAGPVTTLEPIDHIGGTRVAVPAAFFKVILSPKANPPRAIGFIMPNGRVEGGMQKAAVTVDSVETLTGFDFFSALPDEIEDAVESQCNFHQWSTLH